jgi:hypothetical protein
MLNGTAVIQFSGKAPVAVAKSTTAAEYIAVSMGTDDGIVIRKLFADLGISEISIPIFCDNIAACKVLPNPIENSKTKCVDIHLRAVRKLIGWKRFLAVWVNTHQQLAGCFTKPLSGPELCGPELCGPELSAQRRRLGLV